MNRKAAVLFAMRCRGTACRVGTAAFCRVFYAAEITGTNTAGGFLASLP
ncbi:MAG: hypothetical protein HFE77_05875 [Clostridiales bacterium]|nr:hypothetical protein [Clostridiales bacterium]